MNIRAKILVALYEGEFNGSQFKVILAVLTHSYGERGYSYYPLSLNYLKEITHLTRKTVQRAVEELIKAKVLLAEKIGKDRYLRVNHSVDEWLPISLFKRKTELSSRETNEIA